MIRLAIGAFFIVLPFLELILLVKLSYRVGFLWTMLLMIAAAVAGGLVLAQQSAGAFRKALEAASRGETPQAAVLDGMFLMLAGILLVIPGLITDAMALLLLIPPIRHWVAQGMMKSLIQAAAMPDPDQDRPRGPRPDPFGGSPRPDAGPDHPDGRAPFRPKSGPTAPGPVIEGEFQRLDERTPGSDSRRS